jgi:hypothetical protein
MRDPSMKKTRAWISSNGKYVALLALLIAVFIALLQASVTAAPADEIRHMTATPTYVGRLLLQKGNQTGRDGGYGIGVPNEGESNELLKRLRPELFFAFHPDLSVNEEDLARGIRPGLTYSMELWKGQIISISEGGRSIISREEYEKRVNSRKATFLYCSLAFLLSSGLAWCVTHATTRRHEA